MAGGQALSGHFQPTHDLLLYTIINPSVPQISFIHPDLPSFVPLYTSVHWP